MQDKYTERGCERIIAQAKNARDLAELDKYERIARSDLYLGMTDWHEWVRRLSRECARVRKQLISMGGERP
jgi:hypothetical protein